MATRVMEETPTAVEVAVVIMVARAAARVVEGNDKFCFILLATSSQLPNSFHTVSCHHVKCIIGSQNKQVPRVQSPGMYYVSIGVMGVMIRFGL